MKKAYITTAIAYVNGKPHIGNALDYLYADIWARHERMSGRAVRFQVGTDEHGNKVASKAREQGLDPKSYADSMYGNFEDLMKVVNTSYTDFIRTTDEQHYRAVTHIWKTLEPYLYKKAYEGWYCSGCEAFVTDKEATANNGMCPDHNKAYERVSEENYFFKLSEFGPQIREAIEKHKMKIVPEFRKNEILSLIDSGLQDISVSRSTKTLSWGIPVPGDDSQVMYVWFDALSNYISVLGYPDNEEYREYWPADIQLIGKDILRFHAAIWPAMLIGLGLPLPKTLLAHGHVNVGGSKMSKSVGNIVDPFEVIDTYGVDAFRYYFARHIPTQDDGDFTWEKFETAYNNELSNELGNTVQRVVSMINNYQAGVIGDGILSEHDAGPFRDAMRALKFDVALDEVWLTIRSLNQYLEDVKPWMVAKERATNSEAEAHLSEILAHCVGSLQQIAGQLLPFMPNTSQAITKIFADGVITPYQGVLFPRIYKHTPNPRG